MYIILVNFFMLNLFTGATYSNYLREAQVSPVSTPCEYSEHPM